MAPSNQITGNTIFNLLSVSDVDTDAQDRPVNPPRLVSVEVLWNPFDDVVPRCDTKHRTVWSHNGPLGLTGPLSLVLGTS